MGLDRRTPARPASAPRRRSDESRDRRAVDPSLALLEVDRAPWEVPVDDCMAPPVEVDALLPDAGRDEDERSERAVERRPDSAVTDVGIVTKASAVPQSEAGLEGDWRAISTRVVT